MVATVGTAAANNGGAWCNSGTHGARAAFADKGDYACGSWKKVYLNRDS